MIKQDWGRLHQGYSHHPWVHWSKAATGMQLSAMRALIKLDCEWLQQGYNYPPSELIKLDCERLQQGYSYQPSEHWSTLTLKGSSSRDTIISQDATGIQLSAEWALVKLDFERQQKRYSCQPREHWSNWTAKDCSRETVMRALMKLDYKRLQPGYSVISCGYVSQKIQS